MKIKTIIKLADVLDDSRRMPCDMYKLDEVSYSSESRGESIPIADMDIVHLVRAFKKDRAKCVNLVTDDDLILQNRDLVNANKQLGKQAEHYKKLSEDNFIQSVDDSETSNVWKERYEHEVKMAEYWKDAFYKKDVIKGEVKMFSEIPNDADGKAFVVQLKEYLNKESYKMRVRGQYLNEETKQSEGWQKYERGQPIDKSKCLRIYVDIK